MERKTGFSIVFGEFHRSVPVAPLDQHAPAGAVWKTQKAAVIPIPDEGSLHPTLEFIRTHGRKMTAWLPLTTAHGKIGVLTFGSCSSTVYTDDVVAFMEQVAAGVAVAVENGMNREQALRYDPSYDNASTNLAAARALLAPAVIVNLPPRQGASPVVTVPEPASTRPLGSTR